MATGDNYVLDGSESALEKVKNKNTIGGDTVECNNNSSSSGVSVSGTNSNIENKTFIKYEDSRCDTMDILEPACQQSADALNVPHDVTSVIPVTTTAAPSFIPPYTTSSTAPSSSSSSSSSCPHYSTLSATHPLQSPDIPPSSLSALFPSICSDSLSAAQYQTNDHNHNQTGKEQEKEAEKGKGMTSLKRDNPLLGQISTISSFASSFASSPSSPHSIFSKESSSLEPQGDGPQSVFHVGCRERSISQLSTPSSFTSSPPSFGVKSSPALPVGLSTSPSPNSRKSFFSYEMLNSALNMNKSRKVLHKCNDKSGMSDLKCSNGKTRNNNTNSNSDSNCNNCSSSSGSGGGSGGSVSGVAPVAVAANTSDVSQGQGSLPAKRPIALYPVPCDSVSKVLIHGFLSQGTEYSFFLPPQEQNEFIGKRVSQSIQHSHSSATSLVIK